MLPSLKPASQRAPLMNIRATVIEFFLSFKNCIER